jgi:peptide/nickel transport system ATP-binding protein
MALLDVRELRTHFHTRAGLAKAVDGVSFSIDAGETLALVGESGCGKSVTAFSILRLVADPPGRIAGGEIVFDGRDLLKLDAAQMRAVRGDRIGDDLPGADDLAESGAHHRRPDRRGRAAAPEGLEARRVAACRRTARPRPHSRGGRACGRLSRTGFPAGCASAR